MFNFLKNKFEDESLEDQRKDLEKFPAELSNEALNGLDCDMLPNTTGEFGKTVTNPIPVNGPIGEMKYLIRLITSDGGLIIHRLGSCGNIDAYEVVSVGGRIWDILYLDMYHPRRSIKAPEGYTFNEFHEIFIKFAIGYSTSSFDPDFPFGLSRFIEKNVGGTLGIALARKYAEVIKDRSVFVRPPAHVEKLKQVKLTGQSV